MISRSLPDRVGTGNSLWARLAETRGATAAARNQRGPRRGSAIYNEIHNQESDLLWRGTQCTTRIYERFSFLTRRRWQNGRILRHSRAMNGSAGLSPSRKRKPEGSTLSGCARNLRKECAGLVAGQAVLTAEIRTVDFYSPSSFPHCHRSGSSPFQYLIATNDIESKLDD